MKPSLDCYPEIPWDRMDLDQFNLIRHFPRLARRVLTALGMTWQSFHLIPIESGRGCPYGCEFCTVTGFFGDSIRFRSNESVRGAKLDRVCTSSTAFTSAPSMASVAGKCTSKSVGSRHTKASADEPRARAGGATADLWQDSKNYLRTQIRLLIRFQ